MVNKLYYLLLSILITGCSTYSQPAINSVELNTYNSFQVGFSPGTKTGSAESIIVSAIANAQKSIILAAYSLTSEVIAKSLIEANNRGVEVRVIADKRSNINNKYSVIDKLVKAGIRLRLNDKYAIFHHKFFVVDEESVNTGSFNFSANAAGRNAENVLYLAKAPQIAKIYSNEWFRLWNESQEYYEK